MTNSKAEQFIILSAAELDRARGGTEAGDQQVNGGEAGDYVTVVVQGPGGLSAEASFWKRERRRPGKTSWRQLGTTTLINDKTGGGSRTR